MLQKIVDFGKKAVITLGLVGLASCHATYAKRDYDRYPGHKKEIALYNVRHILRDVCEESLVTEDYLHCKQKHCVKSSATYHNPRSYSCDEWLHKSHTIDWDKISHTSCGMKGYVVVGHAGNDTLEIQSSGQEDILIDTIKQRQCEDLEEAINIYLEER